MPRKITGLRRHGAGWQAYVRVDGVYLSETFPLDTPIKEMAQWRRDQKATKAIPLARGTFSADALRYLNKVKAMPSFTDREHDIRLWMAIFKQQPRRKILSADIRGHRDAWLNEQYAASTVNHRLRALSNLWTVLDGKRAPNPVRDVPEAEEPDPEPRAVPYALLRAILDELPDRGRADKGGTVPPHSQTKARLRLMAWVGLAHFEIAQLRRRDWDEVAGTLFVRKRRKGAGGGSRIIPLSKEGRDALSAFDAADAWGAFQRSSLHQSFRRACDAIADRETTDSTTRAILLDLRPYDIRHSHATALYRASGDAHAAASILGHRSKKTTDRYIKAAVQERVEKAVKEFAQATRKKR